MKQIKLHMEEIQKQLSELKDLMKSLEASLEEE